jgi:hypothetical protein
VPQVGGADDIDCVARAEHRAQAFLHDAHVARHEHAQRHPFASFRILFRAPQRRNRLGQRRSRLCSAQKLIFYDPAGTVKSETGGKR